MSYKRGIFIRIRHWLFGDHSAEPPGPSLKLVEYAPPADNEPIMVSAKGSVFMLQLVPTFRWFSSAMIYQELEKCAARYHESARRTLSSRVWATARQFRPDEITEAETAINEVLTEEWCFEDEAGRLGYRSTVRVLPDPEMREHLLAVEKRRLDLNADHDLAMLRADFVEKRTQRWLDVIKVLEALDALGPDERQMLVPFAASLADTGFAEVMHALGEHRGQLARDLASVLRQARSDHESVGLYEFANAYDKALQSFCRRMGLTPFTWAQTVDGDGGAA